MALGSNVNLYTVANKVFMAADNTAGFTFGTDEADSFIVADGNVGDETIDNFQAHDSLVTHKKIYDSNNDGYIWFGENGILDVDRTSSKNAGADQLTLTGSSKGLRYLGVKSDQADGTVPGSTDYVYADAYTRTKLQAEKGAITEGTVGNDILNGTAGKDLYLYDNALGLNLGGDKIIGFEAGKDQLITTTQIFDSNGDDIITFGKNKVLDLAAGDDPTIVEGADVGPGGQISFGGTVTSLHYLGTENINGVDYYFYS